jgi:hypothetical protein
MTSLRSLFQFAGLIIISLIFCGCSLLDALRAPVDTTAAEAQVVKLEQTLTELRNHSVWLSDQLKEAQVIADKSQSAEAAAAVKQLSGMLTAAQAQIPMVEQMVADGKQTVTTLKESGSTVPLWGVLAGLAVPFVAPLIGQIPVIGPLAAPLLAKIANGAWDAYATKRQKDNEADVAAKAAALAYQVDVTRQLISVTDTEKADKILADAKSAQRAAGVHLVLRQAVAESELKAA